MTGRSYDERLSDEIDAHLAGRPHADSEIGEIVDVIKATEGPLPRPAPHFVEGLAHRLANEGGRLRGDRDALVATETTESERSVLNPSRLREHEIQSAAGARQPKLLRPVALPPAQPRKLTRWVEEASVAAAVIAVLLICAGLLITLGGEESTPSAPSAPKATLTRGRQRAGGYNYAIRLAGYKPVSSVLVSCRDSGSPNGFYSFNLRTDRVGGASGTARCYSGDGPEHWIVAGGIESAHVRWGSPASTRSETAGGSANTWSNYANAGGTQGPTIRKGQTVKISCKVTGFRVAGGNTWWYRIAQAPWNSKFYASADAFYNSGQTSGSLRGTPFVDPAVPDC